MPVLELDLLFADSVILELELFFACPFTLSVGEPTWFPFSSHSRGTNAIGAGNRDSPRVRLEPQNSAQNVITQHSVVFNTHSIAQNAPMPFPGEVVFAAAVTDSVIPAIIGTSAKTAIPTTRQKRTHVSSLPFYLNVIVLICTVTIYRLYIWNCYRLCK